MDDLTDAELDALLARSAPVPPAPAARTAAELARKISAPRGLRAWWRHRSIRIGAAVGAALVLAGAGTITAYEMSIPPFVGVPPDVIRVRPGVSVEYTDSLGRRWECLAFLEFENIDDNQYKQLAAISESPTWVGWGDRTLQELGLTDAPPDQQSSAIGLEARREMQRQAAAVIPGLVIKANPDGPVRHASTDGPAVSGFVFWCPQPDSDHGRP